MDPWYKTKSKPIRDLIDKYPPGTSFEIDNRVCWVIAYTEGEDGSAWGLRLSYINPTEGMSNYIAARENNFTICLNCLESKTGCSHKKGQQITH